MKKYFEHPLFVGTVESPAFVRADEDGFVTMFNGKDLSGWDGSPDLWSVRDGVITGQTTPDKPAKENTFLIWTNGQPGDFEMRCSFRIEANNTVGFANSGVQFRSKVVKPSYWVVAGYQADMEAGPKYTGGLLRGKNARHPRESRPENSHPFRRDEGSNRFYSAKAQRICRSEIHGGDWNEYVIIAKGNHLEQFINGKQMIDTHR